MGLPISLVNGNKDLRSHVGKSWYQHKLRALLLPGTAGTKMLVAGTKIRWNQESCLHQERQPHTHTSIMCSHPTNLGKKERWQTTGPDYRMGGPTTRKLSIKLCCISSSSSWSRRRKKFRLKRKRNPLSLWTISLFAAFLGEEITPSSLWLDPTRRIISHEGGRVYMAKFTFKQPFMYDIFDCDTYIYLHFLIILTITILLLHIQSYSRFVKYTGFRIYGPRFCPDKVDHIAEMTIYLKNLVLKSDWPLTI